jgi:hypothetical protein
MLTKVCTTCEVEKSVDDYYNSKVGKYGFKAKCKCCVAEQKKAYQQANKEAIAAYQKVYRQANREAIAKQEKIYYEANKKTELAYQRAYHQANREILLEKQRAYKQTNRHIFNALQAKRKANKLMATPAWANLEAIKGIYELAAIVNRTSHDLHVDHIVPLQSKLVCGLHCEANLRLMAASDNISKGNRHWPDMP